jgi:hypothetical protein
MVSQRHAGHGEGGPDAIIRRCREDAGRPFGVTVWLPLEESRLPQQPERKQGPKIGVIRIDRRAPCQRLLWCARKINTFCAL